MKYDRKTVRMVLRILERHKREVMDLEPSYCHELICAMQEVKELLK